MRTASHSTWAAQPNTASSTPTSDSAMMMPRSTPTRLATRPLTTMPVTMPMP